MHALSFLAWLKFRGNNLLPSLKKKKHADQRTRTQKWVRLCEHSWNTVIKRFEDAQKYEMLCGTPNATYCVIADIYSASYIFTVQIVHCPSHSYSAIIYSHNCRPLQGQITLSYNIADILWFTKNIHVIFPSVHTKQNTSVKSHLHLFFCRFILVINIFWFTYNVWLNVNNFGLIKHVASGFPVFYWHV